MRKTLVFATGLACSVAMASGAYAADKVTIQLKWVTQAQFAGYYVAKAKGIYKDADLDVHQSGRSRRGTAASDRRRRS